MEIRKVVATEMGPGVWAWDAFLGETGSWKLASTVEDYLAKCRGRHSYTKVV